MSKSNSNAFLLLFCCVYFHQKEAVKAFKPVVLNLSTPPTTLFKGALGNYLNLIKKLKNKKHLEII